MNEGMIVFFEMLALALIVGYLSFSAGWDRGYDYAQKERDEAKSH